VNGKAKERKKKKEKEKTFQEGKVYAQENHLWKTLPEDTAGRVLYHDEEANRQYGKPFFYIFFLKAKAFKERKKTIFKIPCELFFIACETFKNMDFS
jgi:hypothetical protein